MTARLLFDGRTHQIALIGSCYRRATCPEPHHCIMPGIRMRCVIAQALCIILAFGSACHASPKACSPKDAEAADAAIDGLDTWTKVQRAYKKYGHCDDGSIAEGNSEAIARLLVDHWNTLPQLAELVKRDPPFKRFVLRHIDTTLDTDDLDRIAAFASKQCPAENTPLCRELAQAAARAAKKQSLLFQGAASATPANLLRNGIEHDGH